MNNIDIVKKKFGVVYTPERLADFVSELLLIEANKESVSINNVLDPSCGEGALLDAMKRNEKFCGNLHGIDIDELVISLLKEKNDYNLIHNNVIMPKGIKNTAEEYWINKLPSLDAIVANPPWSTYKAYNRETLEKAGYSISAHYNDIYTLFVELSIKILSKNGLAAFILPDSIFEAHSTKIREFLAEQTSIKIIARLGEKIFKEVNRATTVIIVQKKKPEKDSRTTCFRLNTDARNDYLKSNKPLIDFYVNNNHSIYQKRFTLNEDYTFDIDTREEEEYLISKIKKDKIDFNSRFVFGRGVEISKKGKVITCPYCNIAQGFTKTQLEVGKKTCSACKNDFILKRDDVKTLITNEIKNVTNNNTEKIFVGENIKRYRITGHSYVKLDVNGINYKNKHMYTPPKILIRKTGLGIYSCVDYSHNYTTQTVYILKQKGYSDIPLEYYIALLNSRVVYYFYLKVYGENEWKSHPYLTKKIIYSLPIKKYEKNQLTDEIVKIASQLAKEYNYQKDIELEEAIMEWYNLSKFEKRMIIQEMNKLPELGAVKQMKVDLDV